MVTKYKKKPMIMEAVQWNGQKEIKDFIPDSQTGWKDGLMTIKTLESERICAYGDYIIKGMRGEFYPLQAIHFCRDE